MEYCDVCKQLKDEDGICDCNYDEHDPEAEYQSQAVQEILADLEPVWR